MCPYLLAVGPPVGIWGGWIGQGESFHQSPRMLNVCGAVTLLFQLVVSLETVRVGVKIPQDGNRANTHGHVAMVREHVWRTLCSVCATGARVARPVPCNS